MKKLLTALLICAMAISLFGCNSENRTNVSRETTENEVMTVAETTAAIPETTTVTEENTITNLIEETKIPPEPTENKFESVSMKKHREFEWSYCEEIANYFKLKENYTGNPANGVILNYGGTSNIGFEPDMGINTITFTRPIDGGILNSEINIGSKMQTVFDTLGNSNVSYSDGYIYYFDGFSLMFYGEDIVQFIAIASMPEFSHEYNKIPFIADSIHDEVDYSNSIFEVGEKYPVNSNQHNRSLYNREFLIFPNGIAIETDIFGIWLCRNYYTDWDTFSKKGSINICEKEMLLDNFIDFCVMYNSSEWLDNPSETLSVFPKENIYKYNSSIIIKSNDNGSIQTVDSYSLLSSVNKFNWLTDDIWIISTHSDALYTANSVTIYNCKTDTCMDYYSATSYDINENNDGITLHFPNGEEYLSTQTIIELLNERT